MCNGRGIRQQGSCQDGSGQVFPGWQSHQHEGARILRSISIAARDFPTSRYHYALEFNVSFAGAAGIAFNISTLSQHRWNASANWSSSIAQTDLLHTYDKRDVVESTLRAMGLDHTRVPTTCDPGYRHTAPSDDEASAKAHAARVRAIMSGEAPPQLGAGQPRLLEVQQLPKSSGVPLQPACAASGPTRTGHAMGGQSSLVDPARVYKTPATPADKPYRVKIPVSRQASRDAIMAMEHNPQGFTMGEWYVWYLSEEIGTDLFQQHFQHIKPPSEDFIQAIADVEDKYPFGPDNGIVDKFTPEMTKNLGHWNQNSRHFGQTLRAKTYQTMQLCTKGTIWSPVLWRRFQARFGST